MGDKKAAVVSRTTILIVAGILIAVSARGLKPYSIDFACMMTGLLGIMAYLILEYGAYRRLRQRYCVAKVLQQLGRDLQEQFDAAASDQDGDQQPAVGWRTDR